MVAFGGVDPLNGTGLALDVLAADERKSGLEIDVVLGSRAPHIDAVRTAGRDMGSPRPACGRTSPIWPA